MFRPFKSGSSFPVVMLTVSWLVALFTLSLAAVSESSVHSAVEKFSVTGTEEGGDLPELDRYFDRRSQSKLGLDDLVRDAHLRDVNLGSRQLSTLSHTIINSFLSTVTFEVDTSFIPISSFSSAFGNGNGQLDFDALIGSDTQSTVHCTNFSITGDLRIIGAKLSDLNGRQREKLTLSASGIQVGCDIPIKVILKRAVYFGIPIGLEFLQDDDTRGVLNLKTGDGISFIQALTLESPNFATTPPTKVSLADGSVKTNSLIFDADNVLALFDNIFNKFTITQGVQIDLDPQLEKGLKDQSALVTAPIEAALQDQLSVLMEQLAEILQNNPLTDTSANGLFPAAGLGDLDGNGEVDALKHEDDLIIPPGTNLLNLTRGNFLVNLLFPEGGSQEGSVLSQFFDTFQFGGLTINQTDAVGLIEGLLNVVVDANLTRPIENLDLIKLLSKLILDFDPNSTLIGGTQENPTLIAVNNTFDAGFASLGLKLVITQLLLSEDGDANDQGGFLDGMQAIGAFTILLPGFDFGSFKISAAISFDASIDKPADDFLPAFQTSFPTEFLNLNARFSNINGQVAGLFVIDEDLLFDIQVGPLIDDPFECLSSSLFTDVILTGLSATADGVDAELSGFKDLVTNLVGDAFNSMLFAYQSIVMRALESLLASQLVKEEEPLVVIGVGICEVLNETMPGGDEPYDFSQGIFQDLIKLADASFVEEMIGFLVSPDGKSTFDIVSESDNLNFGLNLFPLNGWFQRLDISIRDVKIGGISPPKIREASIFLDIDEEFFPQGIEADVKAASNQRRINIILDVEIDISAPQIHLATNNSGGFVSPEPPQVLIEAEGTNQLNLAIEFLSVDALLEVYAKLSVFSVEGTTIRDALNLNCWTGKLEPFGGWTNKSAVEVGLANVIFGCNCETPVLAEFQQILSKQENWVSFERFLQDLVDLLVKILPDRFSEAKFDTTVTNAALQCQGLDPVAVVAQNAAIGITDNSVYGFLGLLALSLFFTLPCCLCRRVRAVTGGKKKREEDEHPDRNEPEPTPEQLSKIEAERALQLQSYAMFKLKNATKMAEVPLYKNTRIPKTIRMLIPTLFFMNLVLFLYGHLGVSVVIGLTGNIFGAPLVLQEFGTFSVLSSTIDLLNNGAVGLAVLILILAVGWPYLKIFTMMYCFLCSPDGRVFRLNIDHRGAVLHILDALGKWSFIEMFFIIALRLIFELSVGSPAIDFLPSDIYLIELNIDPQASFYTFSLAVLFSIVVSNIMVFYHDKIVRDNQNELRYLVHMKETNQSTFVKMSVKDFEFKMGYDKPLQPGYVRYTWHFTRCGAVFYDLCSLVVGALLILASTIPVVTVNYLGLARLLMEFDNQNTEVGLSIASIAKATLKKAQDQGDSGGVFLVLLFIATQLVVPLLLLFSGIFFMHKELSLTQQRRFRSMRAIMFAWSTLEVFVLTVAVGLIEIPSIAGYISGDSCDFLVIFMSQTLEPMGLVSQDDIDNTCFGIKMSLPHGSYVLLVAVFLCFFHGYVSLQLTDALIKQRKDEANKKVKFSADTTGADPWARIENLPKVKPNYTRVVRFFKSLKIIDTTIPADALEEIARSIPNNEEVAPSPAPQENSEGPATTLVESL